MPTVILLWVSWGVQGGKGYAMEGGGDEQREVVFQGGAAGVGGVVGVGAELGFGAGEAVEGGWAGFEAS